MTRTSAQRRASAKDSDERDGTSVAVVGEGTHEVGVAVRSSGDALPGTVKRRRRTATQETAPAERAARPIPLNRHGIPDRRFTAKPLRANTNEARARKRPGKPPGEAWRLRLEAAYGPPHRWELLDVGVDARGRKARSGYTVKRYVTLRCLEHADETAVIAGRGEAQHYGGVVVPKRREGRPSIERPEFRSRFLDAPTEPVRPSGAPQVLRIPHMPDLAQP